MLNDQPLLSNVDSPDLSLFRDPSYLGYPVFQRMMAVEQVHASASLWNVSKYLGLWRRRDYLNYFGKVLGHRDVSCTLIASPELRDNDKKSSLPKATHRRY